MNVNPMMGPLLSDRTYNAAAVSLDNGFAFLCREARRNARRALHLVMAMLPLLALLVGSCKTSQSTYLAGNAYESPSTFQAALFPDRAGFQGVSYTPAAGYIRQARGFVEDAPQALMMLTRTEIGYIFGKPTLQRRDADAEVWQYKTEACVVNLYFYGNKPLSFVDIRRTEGNKLIAERPSLDEQSDCLRGIDAPGLSESTEI